MKKLILIGTVALLNTTSAIGQFSNDSSKRIIETSIIKTNLTNLNRKDVNIEYEGFFSHKHSITIGARKGIDIGTLSTNEAVGGFKLFELSDKIDLSVPYTTTSSFASLKYKYYLGKNSKKIGQGFFGGAGITYFNNQSVFIMDSLTSNAYGYGIIMEVSTGYQFLIKDRISIGFEFGVNRSFGKKDFYYYHDIKPTTTYIKSESNPIKGLNINGGVTVGYKF